MTITVRGLPAPQGSKSFKGMAGGHAILAESSKKVKPWREAVKWAIIEASVFTGGIVCIGGALEVTMVFTMPRPKSARRGSRPSTRPDLDKLVRSTSDAMTDIGIIEDDSRIVLLHASKVFPLEGDNSLSSPGVVIIVDQI